MLLLLLEQLSSMLLLVQCCSNPSSGSHWNGGGGGAISSTITTSTTLNPSLQPNSPFTCNADRRPFIVVWEEVIPKSTTNDGGHDDEDDDDLPKKQPKPPRQQWISYGPFQMEDPFQVYGSQQQSHLASHHQNLEDDDEEEEQHPLRTNEWLIQVRWKQQRRRGGATTYPPPVLPKSEELLLDFDSNGFVRWCCCGRIRRNSTTTTAVAAKSTTTTSTSNNNHPPLLQLAIGTWKLWPTGIHWNLPLLLVPCSSQDMTDKVDTTTHTKNDGIIPCSDTTTSSPSPVYYYQFHASFHPNPFGTRPKMVRGIITQCRRSQLVSSRKSKWSFGLRPVVGTFVGHGVGDDLYDVSKKKRTMGLPKQVMNTPTTSTTK